MTPNYRKVKIRMQQFAVRPLLIILSPALPTVSVVSDRILSFEVQLSLHCLLLFLPQYFKLLSSAACLMQMVLSAVMRWVDLVTEAVLQIKLAAKFSSLFLAVLNFELCE